MSDGRRSQVVLLDERRLDLVIQPRLYAGELLDMVASHFHLKEKEYFGIAFINDANQYSWLQLDKRVLEHELPKKASSQGATLTLHFRVKYFVESIAHLKDAATVEAFYLQAKSLLSKGDIEAESETVFELAALVVQATYGDYVDDLMFKTQLRRLPVLPSSIFKEHPSINICDEKVLFYYKEVAGQTRGDAIVNYLSIIESLPTYGQHYYEIKDKTGSPCWLGLSYKGISQYDKDDRRNPRRVFLWKQLENLYYRDKKFTIEVHEARRVIHTLSSFNLYEDAIEEPVEDYDDLSDAICDPTTQVSVSRRALAPANVTVYVWYASSPIVTKCIWSMAISQHHFFLDRKHLKSEFSTLPSLNRIASELCRSVQSLSSAGSLSNISRSRSNSSGSLPSTILGGEISEESRAAALEMLGALRTRKEALEDVLAKKTKELKALCLQEGELTGEIPPETPLLPGEAQPQVRRRIGTSFSLSDRFISKSRNKERETLNELELQYEIQGQIASAAFQLMNSCNSRKSVRKHRKLTYDQATIKLRDIEHKLCTLKRERKKEKLEGKQSATDDGDKSTSDQEPLDDSGVNLAGNTTESSISPQSVNDNSLLKNALCTSSVPSSSLPQLTVTECESLSNHPCSIRQRHQSLQQLPYTNTSRSSRRLDENSHQYDRESISSYCTRIDYDSVSCGSAAGLPLRVKYRNRFEPSLDIDGSNLYSVPNRRASQVFDSQDDLLLSGKKSDFECDSSVAKAQDGQPVYSNTLPLSASYDESMWYTNAKDNVAISSDCSSLETSFEAHSNNSCDTTSLSHFESHSQNKQGSVSSAPNLPKQIHFRSENSLHSNSSTPVTFPTTSIEGSEQIPPLRTPKIAHVCSVPHLYSEPTMKSVHDQFPRNNPSNSASHQSINQVVDLVQASMLLQGNKRTSSTSSLRYMSPKIKTKEWIETSLDSPLPPRKQKAKEPCDANPSHNKFQSNLSAINNYKTHPVRLSPFPKSTNQAEPASRHYGRTEVEDHSLRCSNITPTLIDNSCDSRYYGSAYISDEQLSNVDCTSLHNFNYSTADQENSSLNAFNENSSLNTFHENSSLNTFHENSSLNTFHENSSLNIFQENSSLNSFQENSSLNSFQENSSLNSFQENSSLNTYQENVKNVNTSLRFSSIDKVPSVYSGYCDPAASPFLNSNPSHSFPQPYQHAPLQNPSYDTPVESAVQPLTRRPELSNDTYVTSAPNMYNTRYVNSNVQTTQQFESTPVLESVELSVNVHSDTIAALNSVAISSQQMNDIQTSFPQNNDPVSAALTVNVCEEVPVPLSPCSPSFPFPPNVEVNVVSVGHFQPYWEETKPYELSDFYKYSTKHRKPQPEHSSNVENSSKPELTDSAPSDNTIEFWNSVSPNPVHCAVEVTKGFASAPKYVPNVQRQSKEILVNAHLAVVEDSNFDIVGNNCVYEKSIDQQQTVNSPPPSKDEPYNNVRVSLADTFHEEMLAWYENRESVKKATLV